jgi:hypothetical protein
LADLLKIPRASFDRYYYGKTPAPNSFLNALYGFAFQQKLALAEIKSTLALRELKEGEIPLFHGSRHSLLGEVLPKGRKRTISVLAFIWEKVLSKPIFFSINHPNSNCYEFAFRSDGLSFRHFDLSFEWMVAIAYYPRGDARNPIVIKGLAPAAWLEKFRSERWRHRRSDCRQSDVRSPFLFFRNAVHR